MENESSKYLHPVPVTEKNAAVYTTDEVFGTVAVTALSELKGISALADHVTGEPLQRGSARAASRAVRMSFGEQRVCLTVSLIPAAGFTLREVCEAVQEKIMTAVHDIIGYQVVSVNVIVSDVMVR